MAPAIGSRKAALLLLIALCAMAAAASAEELSEQMLEDLPADIAVPESIELEGNPGALAETPMGDVQVEDDGIDEVSAKSVLMSSKTRVSRARARIARRLFFKGCRRGICVGTSSIDLTFVVDGKNFQQWRKFAAKLVNRLRVARYHVRVNMIVAGTKPHMLFDFDSTKGRIVSKIMRTRYTSAGGNVALGEAFNFYRKRVLKHGRRFSGKLILVLTSQDSNFGRSVVEEVNYLSRKGVTFLPVMVGYDVSQEFWKSRATGGKYVWVKQFSDLQFVVDAFVRMRISWKMKMTMSSILKCPKPVRYKTSCKHGFRETLEIGFVKLMNKCNAVTKVIKRKECGCEKGQCFASQAMELIIVMQASADLGDLYFGYEKEFVIAMIQKMKIGAKSVRVSVVLFSDKASLAFRLTQYTTQASVISAVRSLKLLTGVHRAIGDALLLVREQVLIDSVEKSAKMLIVITAGESDIGRSVEIESASLLERSVSILVIGVGPKITAASLQVISKVYIHIHTWVKLRFAASYVLRMRISFVAVPAVHGALRIRCPKYKRVLMSKCVRGFKTRIIKFYQSVSNTCIPKKLVKRLPCTRPLKCVEGTKIRVGKCDYRRHVRLVTRIHTKKIHDCSKKTCVWRCSRRLVVKKLRCRIIRCVKRRLTIERKCSKSGVRRIYWGFYSSRGGRCRRVRTKIVRQVPCGGCAKRQIRIFHVTIGKKCVGGQKAIYSRFFASRKGKCSYQRLLITRRRCVLAKRCKRKARIQIDTDCLRKGSRFRGIYWTYRTRLQADGPCVRVRGRLIRLIPCGECTREQRSFREVTHGKKCKSGFITSYVTVYQGEESRACHKTKVIIRKRTCKSCGKPHTRTTRCIDGYRRTYRVRFTTVRGRCVKRRTLQRIQKCGTSTGCRRSHKVHTRCSRGSKYSFTTTYYYEKKKVCTGVPLPPSRRTCSKVADLVFVLDSSTSIHDADFARESQFVQRIVNNMGVSPTGVRVAVITFSTAPKLVFNLDTYSTKSKILDAMRNLPRDEGVTMTYAAIDLVDSDIFPKRRAGVPFVVVVITDGKSTMGDAIASADVLKKKGARFVSVGIYNPDPSVTDKINPAELRGISSTGKYWRADDFTKLDSIVNSVTRDVCKVIGPSKEKGRGKLVCRTICVRKHKRSDRKRCLVIDCHPRSVVRHCKKHRAYRIFARVTYTWNGKKCVPKHRKVIKKVPCPPRRCPKAKIIRTHCKRGVTRRTRTSIFYVSTVRCTRSLPPRCTQVCIRKVLRSSAPCIPTKCKRTSIRVTKCGDKRRFRSVITTRYRRVKGVCKKRVTTKHFPCPVHCPKTKVKYLPCAKGRKYEIKSTITYVVVPTCVRRGKCTVRCVRRVLRERKTCTPVPPPKRCKNPQAYWTKCLKHSAYKYRIKLYFQNVRGKCVIVKRITRKRLLCPPKPCPKSKKIVRRCRRGVKYRTTTTVFYISKISCSKKHRSECRQLCIRHVTRSAVPCKPIIGCDTAKKVRVTKCGGKRRYRSVITKWATLVGGVCKKHRTVKHFPCPIKCRKSRTVRRSRCTKGRKYREVVITTSTVEKRCRRSICTLHCVKKTIRSRLPCPRIVCRHRTVVRKCRKDSKFQYVVRIFYRAVRGRCVSYRSKTVKKIPCPPRSCPKSKKIVRGCKRGRKVRMTTIIFYVSRVSCTRSLPPVCRQACIRRVTRSAVPCDPIIGCDTTKKVRVTKCGGKRRFRSVITTWFTRVGRRCKRHRAVRHFPCPVRCPTLRVVRVPCIRGRRFSETRTITYTTKKSCRRSVCVLRCVRKVLVARIPCGHPPVCRPRKRILPCSKTNAYRKIVLIHYKFLKGKCRPHGRRVLKKIPCRCKRGSTKIDRTCRKGFRRVVKIVYIRIRGVCRSKRVVLRRIRCGEPVHCNRSYYVVTSCFHGVRRLLYVTSRHVKSRGKFTCVSKTTVVSYFDCQPDCRHGVQKKLVLGCKCVRSHRNLYQITFTAMHSKCTHSVKLMGKVSCNDCLSYLKRWRRWMLRLKLKKVKILKKVKKVRKTKKNKKDRRALLGFGYAR